MMINSGKTMLMWLWGMADPMMMPFMNSNTLEVVHALLASAYLANSKQAMLDFWDLEMM